MQISEYLSEIISKHKSGDAGERSYYGIFEQFIQDFRTGTSVTIEKRNSKIGIPDFVVETSKQELIGYVEAKDVGRNLDSLNSTEKTQIEKYRKEYPKLILTNFTEFRLFEFGKPVDNVVIAQPVTLELGQVVLQDDAKLQTLLDRFFGTVIPKTTSAQALAILLADRARTLRDLTLEEINLDDNIDSESEKLFKLLKSALKPTMTSEEFADVYAQTIVFSLFVARINAGSAEFLRDQVTDHIPKSIPLLRQLFKVIAMQDAPQHIRWQVNQVVEILAKTDVEQVARDFFSHGKARDPIVHFYETFLSKYDSKQREKLGVYYTPDEVVSFITRSVESILETSFKKSDGFADKSVVLLDPAAGTLTFPAHAIRLANEKLLKNHGSGSWSDLVKNHLLKNFYAFEYLIAPYTVGHLKIALTLKGLGYDLTDTDRFQLFLTNTLDLDEPNYLPHPQFPAITEEAKEALEIKKNKHVLVVIGNPPYSGHSNSPHLFNEMTNEYKLINGKPLGEKNIKWLKDDYVKFIRFAQWKIEQNGSGVLGFITNHAWLDNPTFRGMRASLLNTFNELYIINLHGSTLKKETTPAGERDENVFDIQPGVAITIGVKNNSDKKFTKSFDLWGKRSEKYNFLDVHSINNVNWQVLPASAPDYYLVPIDETGHKKYLSFAILTDIFPLNSVGIVTARDELTIQDTPEQAWNTVNLFSSMDPETARTAYHLGPDVQDWKVLLAQKDLKKSGLKRENIVSILYRPFDTRYTYYTGRSKGFHCRPRSEVMNQLVSGRNLALITARRNRLSSVDSFFVSDKIVEAKCGESTIQSYTFPLLRNLNVEQGSLINTPFNDSNINWKLPQLKHLDKSDPQMFFYYTYAVLYSPIYRTKYAEFLKRDFPRVPITTNLDLFRKLSDLGKRLVDLHLLKADIFNKPGHIFEGAGDALVSKRKYDEKTSRIYISELHYFENVSPEIWNYHIGGYQVLDKWLKDRVGRRLSSDDQLHYRKIVMALEKTIEIQKEIDKLYPKIEQSLSR